MYTVSEAGNLQESDANYINLSAWADKEIPNDPAKVAPGSYLTAITWFDGKHQPVRVFSQDPEGNIQQVGWDGISWGRYPSPGI